MRDRGDDVKRLYLVTVFSTLLATLLTLNSVLAANVDKTLVAFNVDWRDGTETGTTTPTFTVAPGDALRLRIENHDAMNHTFTLPHWGVSLSLIQGSSSNPYVTWFNVTTSSADNGKWQFYCDITGHNVGTYPNKTGMVGWIEVATPTAKPTPGFEAVAALGAVGGAFLVLAVWRHRKG